MKYKDKYYQEIFQILEMRNNEKESMCDLDENPARGVLCSNLLWLNIHQALPIEKRKKSIQTFLN